MTQSHPPKEPIAIIGSGCRLPGQSSSPSKLWKLLRQPRDVQTEVPSSRFNSKAFYHPDHAHHGTSNVRHSYFLEEDHRVFDAQFFGVKPAEAHCMDPQHRLLLETVYESIESAGLRLEDLRGSQTAVYVGLMYGDYADMVGRDPESFPTYVSTGTARSILSNRVSYFFDWHGPSMTIDTACSSSLVAVHEAVQTLRGGRSRVAVAAGSNLCLAPEPYIAESKLQMLSPTGRSRMWDAKADGYARGDGVAAIVLKTLSNALADGDYIECIIRETGVNQDGRTKGITMPSALAQASLIRDTYTRAGLDLGEQKDRCQYFEAHGTGTPTGDPLEAEAISKAFFPPETKDSMSDLYVGSIKTIVGHTEGTAGLAGLLKASLALKHATIPPNMLFDQLNPNIEPFYSKLEIATSAKPWPALQPGVPRRASVNSFGFGGTNAHAILEAYEAPTASQTGDEKVAFTPFVFSAMSTKSLRRILSAHVKYLEESPSVNMRDLSWTLQSRRSRFPVTTYVSGATSERLLANLRAKLGGNDSKQPPTLEQQPSRVESPRLLGVFTGQGAQWATMGREMWQSATVRQIIQGLDYSLQSLPAADRPEWTLASEFTADASDSRIATAEVSQPMCTAVQLVLVQLLQAAGVNFHAVVGHSSGEIAAAYAAGFISAEDAIRIAYYRGLCSRMAQGPNGEKGAMMAVGTSFDDAVELCEEPEFQGHITVAAVNSSNSVTLSGDTDVIELAKEVLDEENKFARILVVDKAYHSHHMRASSDRYISLLQNSRITVLKPQESACAWYSSVRGELMTWDQAGDLADVYWNENMLNTVLYSQAVECAVEGTGPFNLAIEVGPHPALRGPTLQNIQDLSHPALPYTGTLQRNSNDVEAMAGCLGYLWQMLPPSAVNLSQYDAFVSGGPEPRLLKDQPSYQWDHDQVFWYESRMWKTIRSRMAAVNPLLGSPCPDGIEQEFRWRNFLTPRELPWLSDHRIQGQMVFPGAAYVSAAIEAAKAMSPNEPLQLVELLDLLIPQAIIFSDESSSVETVISITDITHEHRDKNIVLANFAFYSAVGKESTTLTRNASARLKITYGAPCADALPIERPSLWDMVDVPSERFYTALEPLGYSYTGPFRALADMKRRLGVTTGSVVRLPTPDLASLTLHPAMLDAAIQTVLLAKSFPGDGELWSLLVPKGVRRIIVNPDQCSSYDKTVPTAFQVDSVLTQADGSDTTGDIDIYSPDGRYTIARMEGIQAVPVEAASANNDRPFFSGVEWRASSPDTQAVPFGGKATAEDYELANVMERVAVFYLRQMHFSFPDDHRARREGPYVGLLRFAAHVNNLVASGCHRYAPRDWADDTHATILRESERYPHNVDLAVMHIIADHIVDAIEGRLHILEHLTKDNMLGRYYEQAMGIAYFTEYVGKMVAHIAHRYPHMKILEIGAGTGAATKQVMGNVGTSFASYTFTDISSGFFERARELFSSYQDRMQFQILDIEKDVTAQGFQEHSYDIVIASFVLHATSKLEESLHNARRLLKPGGYLVLLEVTNLEQSRVGYIFGSLPGWWLGADDGRVLSPCVTTDEWDRLLRKTGFSGVDTVTSDADALPFPASGIVSQAVDSTTQFLRDPLTSGIDILNRAAEIVIVGGASKAVHDLRQDVLGLLQVRFDNVTIVDSLQDLVTASVPSGAVTLNLSDLDNPVFKNMTSESLTAIKLIYERSQYVLWVTEDSRGGNAYHYQSLGFGRSMAVELPHVQSQFLDLDSLRASSAGTIVSVLLRFIGVNIPDSPDRANRLLWTTEPEVAVVQGKEMIPRVKLSQALNTRYNASRRAIAADIDLRSQDVKVERNGSSYSLTQSSLPDPSSVQPNQKRVRLHGSSLNTVCVGGSNYLYMVAGTVLATGEEVIGFATSNCSTVDISESWTVPVRGSSAKVLLPYAVNHTVARAILAPVDEGGVVIVAEPDMLISSILEFHASQRGIRVVYVTSQANSTQPSWTVFHPQAHLRSMQKALPQEPVTVLDMGVGADGSRLGLQLQDVLHQSSSFQHFNSFFGRVARCKEAHVPAQAVRVISMCQDQYLARAIHAERRFIPINEVSRHPVSQSTPSLLDWSATESVSAFVRPIDQFPLLRGDRTYWLVGLTGSLGLSLCQWLVRHGARNVVLTSRNPKIDAGILDEIASSEARVEIYPGDVTNRESLRMVYERICKTLPRISGVAQGAMVLQDTMIKDMDITAMQRVLKPKVAGSIYLDEIFSETHPPLDFFVFFSSATCVTGNIGQSNYAAANMFMASMAAKRKRRGLAGSVIHIGAIMGVGYVTRETTEALQRNLLKSGHVWMSESDFHTTFAEAILAGSPKSDHGGEITCGLRVHKATEEQRPLWSYNPQFQHLVLQEKNESDTDAATLNRVPLKVQLREARTPDEIYEVVKGCFLSKLQMTLGLDDMPDRSVIDKAADDLGIDSLNIVEIRSWFLKELKADIPVLRILGGATIEEIIRFALEKLPEEMVPNLESTVPIDSTVQPQAVAVA